MKKLGLLVASVMALSMISTPNVKAMAEDKGKVVVYAPSPNSLNEKINKLFTEKTGIAVETFNGTTGEILAKLETEKENPVADVVIMASWPEGMGLQSKDMLLSYVPKGSEKLVKTFIDDKKTMFGYSSSAVGIIYNKDIFPDLEKENVDINDFKNEKYKDQIAIPDPAKSGSCKDFLAGYINVNKEKGYENIEALFKNGLAVAGANKAALEMVLTGEKGVLIAGVDYNAYAAMKKGEPIGIYYPKSGTVVNPRPAMILKTSKNVENAKKYMDFLMTEDAQKLVADEFLIPGLDGYKMENRVGMDKIQQLKADWKWMISNAKEVTEKFTKLNEGNKN